MNNEQKIEIPLDNVNIKFNKHSLVLDISLLELVQKLTEVNKLTNDIDVINAFQKSSIVVSLKIPQ